MITALWLALLILGGIAVLVGYHRVQPHPRLPHGVNKAIEKLVEHRKAQERKRLIQKWNYWAEYECRDRDEAAANRHMASGGRLVRIFKGPEFDRGTKWRIYQWAFQYVMANVVPEWQEASLRVIEAGAGQFPTPQEALETLQDQLNLYGRLLRQDEGKMPWLDRCPFSGEVPDSYSDSVEERLQALVGIARAFAYLGEQPENPQFLEPLGWYSDTYQYPGVVKLLLESNRWRALEGIVRMGGRAEAQKALKQMGGLENSYLPELMDYIPSRIHKLLDSQTGAGILAGAEGELSQQLIRRLGTKNLAAPEPVSP